MLNAPSEMPSVDSSAVVEKVLTWMMGAPNMEGNQKYSTRWASDKHCRCSGGGYPYGIHPPKVHMACLLQLSIVQHKPQAKDSIHQQSGGLLESPTQRNRYKTD
jgi:hypothetical protein